MPLRLVLIAALIWTQMWAGCWGFALTQMTTDSQGEIQQGTTEALKDKLDEEIFASGLLSETQLALFEIPEEELTEKQQADLAAIRRDFL